MSTVLVIFADFEIFEKVRIVKPVFRLDGETTTCARSDEFFRPTRCYKRMFSDFGGRLTIPVKIPNLHPAVFIFAVFAIFEIFENAGSKIQFFA